MKKNFIIAIFCSFAAFSYAEEKMSGVNLGITASHAKEIYKVSAKEKYSVLPLISVNYKDFYINQSELGYQFQVHDNFLISGYFDFLDGYPVKGKEMQKEYKSIQTRRSQIVGGGRITYFKDNFQTSIFAQGGKRGSSTGADLSLSFPLTEKLFFTTGLNYTIYSKNFTNYYFGVHKEDLGGKLTKVYSPKASYSYGAEASLEYQITEPFSIFTSVSATNYSKEITNSPLVKDKTNISTTIGLQYSF